MPLDGVSANDPAGGPSGGAICRLCSSWPLLTNWKTTFPAGTVVRESVKAYSTALTCTWGTDGGSLASPGSPGSPPPGAGGAPSLAGADAAGADGAGSAATRPPG